MKTQNLNGSDGNVIYTLLFIFIMKDNTKNENIL